MGISHEMLKIDPQLKLYRTEVHRGIPNPNAVARLGIVSLVFISGARLYKIL